MLKRTFGERLAKSRHIADMDQLAMAMALKVSRRTVVRWENDEGFPRTDQIEKWADITGAPLLWLFRDDGALGDTGPTTHGYRLKPWHRDMYEAPGSN